MDVLNYSIFWVILFFVQIVILSIISKNIYANLYILIYRITKNSKLSLYIVSFFFFPGTTIHELSHALSAVMVGGHVYKINLIPQIDNFSIRMGYAQVQVLDVVRNSFIGISPLIFGVILLYLLFPFTNSNDIFVRILTFYTIFQISNSMFLSNSDVIDFYILFFVSLVILFSMYFYNYFFGVLNFLPYDFSFFKTSLYIDVLKTFNYIMLFPILINLFFNFFIKLFHIK